MKEIIDTMSLPAEKFGEGQGREIRIAVSPQTTGDNEVTIVHVAMPPGSVAEEHVHENNTEYICFATRGKAVLDGKEYDIPPQGIVAARPGVAHYCANPTDETLHLQCFFAPALVPYGQYLPLIEKTNRYL